MFKSKRPTFNVAAMRLADAVGDGPLPPSVRAAVAGRKPAAEPRGGGGAGGARGGKAKRSKWSEQSRAFREAINAGRAVTDAIKEGRCARAGCGCA